MSKKEKKVKKEKVPMALETKQTIWKSITAFVCTIAICATSAVMADKYGEALKTVGANSGSSTVAVNNGASDVVADDTTGDTQTADDVTPVSDDTTEPVEGEDTTAAPADDNTAAPASNDTKKVTDPTQYSKAQVVEYYNKCLKTSYAKKIKAKKTETINIVLDSSSAGNIVTKFINGTILPKYAGTTDYDRDFTNGIHGEQKITEYASPYNLTADGAKTAKITKSGSNYVITINVVAEKSTLENPPKYNTMCSHPLDLATVDISPATVTKADFSYPGTTLTATVDASGKVLKTSIKQPLSGTGEGKLGITISATLHGSLDQTVTYTYL